MHLMFFRSNDGGETWSEQDPGLPQGRGDNSNYIRRVQQIDSLNIVAAGDTGLLVRSFDGGLTWHQQDVPARENVWDVHFSDPMTGIAVLQHPTGGQNPSCDIITTHDGGNHWKLAPFSPWLSGVACHSYGGNRFAAISFNVGPVYRTNDDWVTFDSSQLIVNWTDHEHGVGKYRFLGSDTIVGLGATSTGIGEIPYLVHSIDGGDHWDSTVIKNTLLNWDAASISSLEFDPVLIGAYGRETWMGVSHDHGVTWEIDTTIFDGPMPGAEVVRSIAVSNTAGSGVFGVAAFVSLAGHGFLARGIPEQSRVENFERIIYTTHLFPNPASSQVEIATIDPDRPIFLCDVLGRTVSRSRLDAHGQVSLDVTSLPRGTYSVMLDHFGNVIPVGKLVLIEH